MAAEDREAWGHLERLFEAALARPAAERAGYLDAACGADPELRARLERLLAGHDAKDGLLDGSVRRLHNAMEGPGAAGAPASLVGEEIGGFRVVRRLGAGGMGTVYEAEQRQPQRRVALKVLQRGLLAERAVERFELEGQILAHLKHSGIAQVYEAGVHRDRAGELPYLAMELVEGQPLTEHASRASLGVRERIELVIKVCEAVTHAHRKGVVHRDLKPANILVDEAGEPRVLDFGVARVTDADVQAASLRTDIGQLVGTIPYMSPEQAAGDPAQIDTRSDVYALGVILYELLAGRMPLDVRRKPIPEAVRAIREDDPASLGAVSAAFRGDLETIARKALEKDRERRYGSAQELAEDLKRYLHDQPILARPPSAAYQLRKFARRNRVLVAGAGVAFIILALGVLGTAWQALRARRSEEAALALATSEAREKQTAIAARARAEEERDTARKVSDFLSRLFMAIDPFAGTGPEVKVLDLLDRWADEVPRAFPDRPAVQVQLLNAAGSAYHNLGVVERGAAHIELAYRRALEALPEDNADRLEATHNQAILHLRRGRLAEAEKLARQAVAGLPRAPQVSSHLWCAALGGLGSILNSSNHLSEAEAVLREAAGKAARELGPTHYLTLQEVEVLAQNLAKQGRPGEAEKLLADSLDELGEATGGLGLAAARLEANLADLLFTRREFPRAELLARRCLDTFRKAQGESSLATLSARRALATILWGKGDHASAKDLLRGTLDLFANVPAAENQEAVMLRFSCRQDLGRMLAAENDLGGAEVAFRETLAEAKVRLGEEHPESLRILSGLAYQLVLARKYEEAQGLLEQALALQVKLQGEAHPDAVQTRNSYGFCLFRQGKPAEAEEVFRKQLALVEGNPALGSYSWRTLANLVFVLNQEGKLEEVDRFCGRATRAGYAVLPPGNAELHEIEKLWMASRGRLRGEDAVEELLRELWEEQSQAHGAADGHAQRLLGKLVDYLKSRNKPVEAEKYEALRQEKP